MEVMNILFVLPYNLPSDSIVFVLSRQRGRIVLGKRRCLRWSGRCCSTIVSMVTICMINYWTACDTQMKCKKRLIFGLLAGLSCVCLHASASTRSATKYHRTFIRVGHSLARILIVNESLRPTDKLTYKCLVPIALHYKWRQPSTQLLSINDSPVGKFCFQSIRRQSLLLTL